MDNKLRELMFSAARENGAKHGKAAELDFGAGAEWMYEKLTSDNKDYAAALNALDEYIDNDEAVQSIAGLFAWLHECLNSTS